MTEISMSSDVPSGGADCVLFDLDGTLADTAPDLVDALNAVLIAAGRPTVTLEHGRWWVAGGSVRLIQKGFNLSLEQASISPLRQQLLDYYEEHLCEKTQLFLGIDKVLNELDRQMMPWGVVTNKPARFTKPLVKALGLHDRAISVVSGDTVSRSKPDPLPLLHACDESGVAANRTIYVGDDLRDILAGKASGMATAAVTWGYGDPSQIPNWEADWVICQPWDMLEKLRLNQGAPNN
ncbi:HAD-IA family hydrolase [Gammaproteobacteria bacterium]|nr:HAD-IA family hydrolase [Gammaproteobacteria bacterium]MDG2237093.1 HAD-IA family hydrolase [Arenicellales bacterium]